MRDLRDTLRNHINTGNFELAGILRKIDILWTEGSLTDDEREEYKALARDKAPMEKGYAAYEERFLRLEERIKALEEAHRAETGETAEPEEYPAWITPTGAHDAYYAGAKMTWTDGLRYVCTAPEGYAVAYGPDVLPGYWQKTE